jgi:hypothetical protein
VAEMRPSEMSDGLNASLAHQKLLVQMYSDMIGEFAIKKNL